MKTHPSDRRPETGTPLRGFAVAFAVVSAGSSVSDAWGMWRFEAPVFLVVVALSLAGIKLAASAAYARRLRYSRGAFFICFALLSVRDLSFLFQYPLDSLRHVPVWNLRLFTGLALLFALAEAARALVERRAGRHAA